MVVCVHDADFVLSGDVIEFCCLGKPEQRLFIVFHDAFTIIVHSAKQILGFGVIIFASF